MWRLAGGKDIESRSSRQSQQNFQLKSEQSQQLIDQNRSSFATQNLESELSVHQDTLTFDQVNMAKKLIMEEHPLAQIPLSEALPYV